MRVLANESFSQCRCAEAALSFRAIAQRFKLGGKYHEKEIIGITFIGCDGVQYGWMWKQLQ